MTHPDCDFSGKLTLLREELAIKRNRFTEQQITFALREVELGTPVEEENRKLKQLVADLSLDKWMPQDVLSKKW